MDPRSRDAIQQLTRDFYRRHAQSFSDSRDHPWPGWERVAERIPPRPRILDVGCGNGRFASFLAARGRDDVDYTGVDQSEALLAIARSRTAAWPTTRVTLHAADVLAPGALPAGPFDVVVLFGVLLHVPGFDARVDLAARLAERLAPGGFLAATLWHFAMDERALRHTVPFDVHPIDVDATGVEPGDRLLRWQGDTDAVRYCHFADDAEVESLVAATRERGLTLLDRFRSDGRSRDLNEYLLWTRREA